MSKTTLIQIGPEHWVNPRQIVAVQYREDFGGGWLELYVKGGHVIPAYDFSRHPGEIPADVVARFATRVAEGLAGVGVGDGILRHDPASTQG